ncbi:hypothetical protein BD560DRAFT_54618 [Blakeslea trispora]|nr:hypothetical protein BD560DRAFT_54618 [Blakeslea trispora]
MKKNYPVLKEKNIWYEVTAFHAYAHTMNYNPEIEYTDDERFWPYLNGFVSMTRSMSSRNRLLAITDSVEHFTYQKMLELPEQIYKKKRKHKKKISKFIKQKSSKKNTTIQEIEGKWQTNKTLLSLSLSERYFKSLYKETKKKYFKKRRIPIPGKSKENAIPKKNRKT